MSTNFNFTDPNYLRTIYDGLLSGIFHKDNASGLPSGLVDIYEEALQPAIHVKERHKFLEFFSIWALLRKEVSVAFIMPLLGWTEEQVLDYIDLYSKWFNAPMSGTFVLYHERIRSFVLQKISQAQFVSINEAVIELCQTALRKRTGDEWEQYALEHLSTHLLIQAMESTDATSLKMLAYSAAHWDRQLEISKGFNWSKRMLNDLMLWASKYNDDEVIECALNKVDLYYLEQNDAPRIVELVAQNDLDMALKRIDAFGGNDKEGLQRKFILYMLCLMELTLMSGKGQPWSKETIGRILKHLDDNMPIDYYVLDWNDFFPSFLIFEMACEWAELGLDYLIVYKRCDGWEFDWINGVESINPIQLEVLSVSAQGINNQWYKCNTLKDIADKLHQQGHLKESEAVITELHAFAKSINDESDQGNILKEIAVLLTRQGLLNESLVIAAGIIDETYKDEAYFNIALEVSKQGDLDGSIRIIQRIIDESEKKRALRYIAVELSKQGNVEESLSIARGSFNDTPKSNVLKDIAIELSKLGDLERSATILSESLDIVRGTIDGGFKDIILKDIAIERSRQSQFEESLQISRTICEDKEKSLAMFAIAEELSKQGKIEESAAIFQESLDVANGISEKSEKDIALAEIAVELSKQCRLKESLNIVESLSDAQRRNSALKEIAVELIKQGNLEESLDIARSSSDKSSKNNTFRVILIELSRLRQYAELALVMYESIILSRGTSDNTKRCEILKDIASDFIKKGHLDKSLGIARRISIETVRFDAMKNISVELCKQSNLKEALAIASSIGDEIIENNTLSDISVELSKQGKLEEALVIARGINDAIGKSNSLINISVELATQGNSEVSGSLFQESLVIAKEIDDDWDMSLALMVIAVKLSAQGKLDESLETVNSISDDYWETVALNEIAVELAKQGRIQESLDVIGRLSDESDEVAALRDISIELSKQGLLEESLNIARDINDERDKTKALKGIAMELSIKNNWKLSEEIGLDISPKSEQIACWLDIGKNNCIVRGYSDSIQQIGQFKSAEAINYYRIGVVKQINSVTINQNIVLDVLRNQQNDATSIKFLLEIYAIKQIIVQELSEEQCQRFDKSFDLNWVIDIKNQLVSSNSNFSDLD
jgi:tetratricopeptide (TPR) repeat protein